MKAKPKNPFPDYATTPHNAWNAGFAAGLAAGQKKERRAQHKECIEAFKAIATALQEPSGGEYWSARKILDKADIYHDNLQGERVLCEVANLMLKRLRNRAKRRR